MTHIPYNMRYVIYHISLFKKNKAHMYSCGRQMLKKMKRQKVMNSVLVSQMKQLLLTRQAAEITMGILSFVILEE